VHELDCITSQTVNSSLSFEFLVTLFTVKFY